MLDVLDNSNTIASSEDNDNMFAHIDEDTGAILGWYTIKIHGDKIPTPNVEVAKDVWREAVGKNANHYDVDSKQFDIKDFRTEDEILASNKEQKEKQISAYIYKYYPQESQGHDLMTINDYRTKLIAMGYKDIDTQVVRMAIQFFNGATLDDCLSSIDKEEKILDTLVYDMYSKLLKIAIKTEWIGIIKKQGAYAMANDIEFNFSPFPFE